MSEAGRLLKVSSMGAFHATVRKYAGLYAEYIRKKPISGRPNKEKAVSEHKDIVS